MKPLRLAILVSQFNEKVTQGLLKGAETELLISGIERHQWDLISVPGAYELPLLAKKAAKCGKYQGIIALGAVIKGETAHFEFISLATALGLQWASLETEVPISFGVLTTYTEEQALARSRDHAPSSHESDNKGREAARACLKSLEVLSKIS